MLGTFPESFIILILPVFVHGGGEVAGVAAVLGSGLLPRPQLGPGAARRGSARAGLWAGGETGLTTLQTASLGI